MAKETMVEEHIDMFEGENERVVERDVEDLKADLEREKAELEHLRSEKARIIRETTQMTHYEATEVQRPMDTGKRAIIEQLRRRDSTPVTGKFLNRRNPGQRVRLTYNKHPDDPVKWYDFDDGQVYTIPQGFVDQIREYYYRPGFIPKTGIQTPGADGTNSAIAEVDTSNKLYDFVPTRF